MILFKYEHRGHIRPGIQVHCHSEDGATVPHRPIFSVPGDTWLRQDDTAYASGAM